MLLIKEKIDEALFCKYYHGCLLSVKGSLDEGVERMKSAFSRIFFGQISIFYPRILKIFLLDFFSQNFLEFLFKYFKKTKTKREQKRNKARMSKGQAERKMMRSRNRTAPSSLNTSCETLTNVI